MLQRIWKKQPVNTSQQNTPKSLVERREDRQKPSQLTGRTEDMNTVLFRELIFFNYCNFIIKTGNYYFYGNRCIKVALSFMNINRKEINQHFCKY